jgi:hypothetical protein
MIFRHHGIPSAGHSNPLQLALVFATVVGHGIFISTVLVHTFFSTISSDLGSEFVQRNRTKGLKTVVTPSHFNFPAFGITELAEQVFLQKQQFH